MKCNFNNTNISVHNVLPVMILTLQDKMLPNARERIIQSLVVDALIQVFDEHVAHTGFADGRITLGPHDTDWPSLYCIKVHRIQSSLS